MNIRSTVAQSAGVCAVAATAIGLLSAGVAGADTSVPLPGGDISRTLSDGTVVHLWLDGESANINPSMGATPLDRNAWVSGTAHVDVSGNKAVSKVYPGYTVGCQVDISGGGVNASDGVNAGFGDGKVTVTPGNPGGGASLSIGPGQAQSFYVFDTEKADDFGQDIHKNYVKLADGSGTAGWADETIGLTGCAGYAQARSFVSVEVETDHVISWVTLWGQPFSLG